MGGTRMGTNKNDSVVNSDLKVHGINNLILMEVQIFTQVDIQIQHSQLFN